MDGGNPCSPKIPRLMKFTGTLQDAGGQPRTGTVGITFAIYGASTGGERLWQETQNVQLDQQGHYEAMLGAASEGMPMDLFTSGEPRWLGVQVQSPGEEEQSRVLLVSVPYALKAADAETLGGLPASAFARAASGVAQNAAESSPALSVPIVAGTVVTGASPGAFSNQSSVSSGAIANSIPKFSANGSLVNSQITDSNGIVEMKNLANILFAEQFSGGVPAAINACPDAGCVIYALSAKVNLNLGNIDPGSKAITIYLGPYTYNVNQVTLRKALKIIGMGASGGLSGTIGCTTTPCNGTTLQSVNGNDPVFVLPQANNAAATNVLLFGFRLRGSAGNSSEDGFLLDTSSLVNSGLWHSTLKDLNIEGFAGIGIHLKGPNNNFGAISQWLHFDDVVVFRTSGGGNGLRIEGANFEMEFSNCQFDGQGAGDGTNIYIGGLAGGINGYPLNIRFTALVTQAAALGVQIDGAAGISFYSSHHEKLWGVYSITNNTNIGTKGVTIADANFFGVGANNGAGFLLNVGTTLASGIVFASNQVLGSPDSVVTGTNLSQIIYRDNLYYDHSSFNVPPTSGITTQLSPATTLNIGSAHTIGLNPSTTPITTIQSSLGPGEMVTFFMLSGTATFNSGGNINLAGANTVTVSGSITFVRNDLTLPLVWTPVAQWSSGAGTTPSGFTVSASPTSATIHAGDSPVFNLTVEPTGGFSGTVRFTCTGAPAKSTCSVVPNPLTVNGTSPVPATVTVATTAPNAAQLNSRRGNVPVRRSLPAFGSLAVGLVLAVVPLSSGQLSGGTKKLSLLTALLALLLLCVGCGGTAMGSGSPPPPVQSGTPLGVYMLKITGAAGSTKQISTISLTVQ